jgi:hypothetical protein
MTALVMKVPLGKLFLSGMFISKIEAFEIKKDDKFILTLNIENISFSVILKHAYDAVGLYDGITIAKETQKEISRSLKKNIKYNIDIFYDLFGRGDYNLVGKLLEDMCKNVIGDLPLDDYIAGFKTLIEEFDFLIDAFYCRKPLITGVFRKMIVAFHTIIRNTFEKNWNFNLTNLTAGSSLTMLETMYEYVHLLKKLSIKDQNIDSWEIPVMKTFLSYLFEQSKEILLNLLDDFLIIDNSKKDKLYTHVPDNLEFHLNFVLNHYLRAPLVTFAKEIGIFIGNALCRFFINVFHYLKTNEGSIDTYSLIINTNFIRIKIALQKRITDLTKNQITIMQTKKLFNDDFILYLLRGIYRICFDKIKSKMLAEVDEEFTKCLFFLDLDINKVIQNILGRIKFELAKIFSQETQKDMMNFVMLKISEKYILLYLKIEGETIQKSRSSILLKIKSDLKIFKKFSTEDGTDDVKDSLKLIEIFSEFISSNDFDEILVGLINLQARFPELVLEQNLRNLVLAKESISNDLQNSLIDIFLRPREKVNEIMIKYQKRTEKQKMFNICVLVIIFVYKFR